MCHWEWPLEDKNHNRRGLISLAKYFQPTSHSETLTVTMVIQFSFTK
jgi:hypothetical protein